MKLPHGSLIGRSIRQKLWKTHPDINLSVVDEIYNFYFYSMYR